MSVVLQPGDSIHLTLWFNKDIQTQEEVYNEVKGIFENHGVHIYSWSSVCGVPAFPMQVIAFRREEKK